MKFKDAGPHKSEWTSSKGEEAVDWDLWKGRLCILPYKQCVQEWSIELHLLITDLILGKGFSVLDHEDDQASYAKEIYWK